MFMFIRNFVYSVKVLSHFYVLIYVHKRERERGNEKLRKTEIGNESDRVGQIERVIETRIQPVQMQVSMGPMHVCL